MSKTSYSTMTTSPLSSEQPTVEQLQALLREARWYVFHAEVPHEGAYDDQQEMLKKIDELAPPLPEPKFFSPGPCEKEASCVMGKGHEGACCDIPF